MDELERADHKREIKRKWKKEHPEQVREQRRRYRLKNRADITVRARNSRALAKIKDRIEGESRGKVQLSPTQILMLTKLYPGVGPGEAIRLLIVSEANRRIQ